MNLNYIIKDFNEKIKPSTRVYYKNDDGDYEETETRSKAWACCGQGVVLLKGKTGGYNIKRVTQIKL